MLTRHHSSQGESQQGEQAAGAAAEKEKRRTIEREPPAWAWPTCRPCSRVASRFDGPPWLGSIDESVWRSSVPQIESFGTFGSLLVPFGGLWMWTAGVAGHHIEYWAPPRRDDGTAYRFGRVPLRRRCSRLRDQLRGAVVWTWDWTPLSPPAGPNSAHRSAPACHSRLTPPQSHNLFSEQRLRFLPWRPPTSPTRRALGSSPLLRPQQKHPCVRCMFSAHSRRQLHPPHGLSTHRTHVQVWFHFSCFLIFHHSAITDRRLGCGHTADYQHLPTRCTRVRAFHAAEPEANKKNRETRRWNCG